MTDLEIGWYRDPDDPLRHRFWTGKQWVSQEHWSAAVAQASGRRETRRRPRD